MATTAYSQLFDRLSAVKYDGTNSAFVLSMLGVLNAGYAVISANSTHVVLGRPGFGNELDVPAGSWVAMNADAVLGIMSDADLTRCFKTIDQIGVEVGAAVPPTQALGMAAVPSLIGNAQATVQVTLQPAFGSTAAYSAAAVITGGVSLLAALSVVSVTKVSGARVDVVVKNTGLVTLAGATVLVAAVAG